MSVILCMMFVVSYEHQLNADILLSFDFYHAQYDVMIHGLLKVLHPLCVTLLVIDHDQTYLKPFIAYHGRGVVIGHKICFYIGMTLICYVMICLSYIIVTLSMTAYGIDLLNVLKMFSYYFLDGIMICALMLWFARKKVFMITLLILAMYIVYTLVLEDIHILALYYVFPIQNAYAQQMSLYLAYQIVYVMILYVLVFYKESNRSLNL